MRITAKLAVISAAAVFTLVCAGIAGRQDKTIAREPPGRAESKATENTQATAATQVKNQSMKKLVSLKRMLQAAQGALKAIEDLSRRQRRTPERLSMRFRWARRVMDAELQLARTQDQKIAAVLRYLTFCEKTRKAIISRVAIDATDLDVKTTEYRIAEANYLLAEVMEQ